VSLNCGCIPLMRNGLRAISGAPERIFAVFLWRFSSRALPTWVTVPGWKAGLVYCALFESNSMQRDLGSCCARTWIHISESRCGVSALVIFWLWRHW